MCDVGNGNQLTDADRRDRGGDHRRCHRFADSVDALIAEVRSGKRLRPGRTLRGAILIDRDLSGLNLAGADLSGADLSRANLTRTNLVGAKLAGAVLFGATLDHAD